MLLPSCNGPLKSKPSSESIAQSSDIWTGKHVSQGDFKGQVFLLADNSLAYDQVIPWNKKTTQVTLKSETGTLAGSGTISKNGVLSLNVNHQAKVQAYSFKHMLDDQDVISPNHHSKQESITAAKYKCNYSNLEISDPDLKVRSGYLDLKYEMPLLGITSTTPSTEHGLDYLDLLFADRDAKLKGVATCMIKQKHGNIVYKHEFDIQFQKGWNFLHQTHTSDERGDFKSVYKTASKPKHWIAIETSSPVESEQLKMF